MARELAGGEILSLAARGGIPFGERERREPILLHGAAGEVLLRESGVDDPVVLRAVRCHVAGGPGLDQVAKAVYAADLLEPSRRFAGALRRQVRRAATLDEVVLMVAEALAGYHEAEGRVSLPGTRLMIEELRRGSR